MPLPNSPDGFREWELSEIPLGAFFRMSRRAYLAIHGMPEHWTTFAKASHPVSGIWGACIQFDGGTQSTRDLLRMFEWTLTPFDEASFQVCGVPCPPIEEKKHD